MHKDQMSKTVNKAIFDPNDIDQIVNEFKTCSSWLPTEKEFDTKSLLTKAPGWATANNEAWSSLALDQLKYYEKKTI